MSNLVAPRAGRTNLSVGARARGRVTILFGGFTWKHERFIEAVFRGCGYRFQMLPEPDVAAFQG